MNDFDFFIGSWNVVNRRRTSMFDGTDDWETFPATSVGRQVFDGGANCDEIVFPTQGWSGFTLRLFDTERREWSLYWASSRSGLLYPPVVGRFTDGRGDFYGDDTWQGRPIRVRFTWSDITAETARWEQLFSADGGETWESNWIMDFSRSA
ncbi:hypothetical protein Q0Z83_033790 [Actinoplanes sichuanensis]|uniref:DUF1579 domain-containing protein n=1 Tax=Actinoplanes sichuanensis TaxID=512349 RepID=A0ABW4A7F4_9ACTN|nr:hypothetical protein [Actinoplanes sichuanensis]BEL05188.1 hypothetical protein Q0Z83_033790 [Actinoplanes sichuanensis]